MAGLLAAAAIRHANSWNHWKNPLTRALNALSAMGRRYFNASLAKERFFIPAQLIQNVIMHSGMNRLIDRARNVHGRC